MKTLQEHYTVIKNGQGNKAQFLKHARTLFPEYFNQYTDFDTATNVLKSKQIINEAAGGVVSKGFDIFDWKKILAEEAKAEEKNVSKEVEDYAKSNFDNKDMKNADNINFNEIMKGFYCELKDSKNSGKTGDELKDIVVKNLAKDPLYYTKNGEFGVKDLGYTTEAPGLGEPKEPKGKYKSSGYGDIEKAEKVKANVQDSLGDREAKTSMPKKVKEMPDKGVKGVEKKMKLQENESVLRSLIREIINEELNKESDMGQRLAAEYGTSDYIDPTSIKYSEDEEGSWNLEFIMEIPKNEVMDMDIKEADKYFSKEYGVNSYGGPGAPFSKVYADTKDGEDYWIVSIYAHGGYDI